MNTFNQDFQTMSDFIAYSLQERIKTKPDNPSIILEPISFALNKFIDLSELKFLKFKNEINPQTGELISQNEALAKHLANASYVKWNTVSGKFIGLNGAGKTEMSQNIVKEKVKAMGLNPVVLGRHTDLTPQNENDCLIAFMSAVGREAVEIKGLPLNKPITIKKPVVDEFNIPQVDENGNFIFSGTEEIRTIEYGMIGLFRIAQNFNYMVLIIDEINRSVEQSTFNAILNGEPQDGIKMARMGNLIIALANSESDGLNHVVETDMAGRTKTATYHVYQVVEDWARWAMMNDVHPACITFAKQNPHYFEEFVGHNLECGAPTFRTLHALSDSLKMVEKKYKGKLLTNLFVQSLAFNHLGAYSDNETDNVAKKFADFYQMDYKTIAEEFNKTISSVYPNIRVGFLNQQLNYKLLSAHHVVNENSLYPTFPRMSLTGRESDQAKLFSLSAKPFIFSYVRQLLGHYEESFYITALSISFLKNFAQLNSDKKYEIKSLDECLSKLKSNPLFKGLDKAQQEELTHLFEQMCQNDGTLEPYSFRKKIFENMLLRQVLVHYLDEEMETYKTYVNSLPIQVGKGGYEFKTASSKVLGVENSDRSICDKLWNEANSKTSISAAILALMNKVLRLAFICNGQNSYDMPLLIGELSMVKIDEESAGGKYLLEIMKIIHPKLEANMGVLFEKTAHKTLYSRLYNFSIVVNVWEDATPETNNEAAMYDYLQFDKIQKYDTPRKILTSWMNELNVNQEEMRYIYNQAVQTLRFFKQEKNIDGLFVEDGEKFNSKDDPLTF